MRWIDVALTPEAQEIKNGNLPGHVAVIMDGNGRWAQERGLPRSVGHRYGMEALRKLIRLSGQLHVQALTVYAFSTENIKRPLEEISFLMGLIVEYFKKEMAELMENSAVIRYIGDLSALPQAAAQAVEAAREQSKHNTGLIVNLALNYGGRDEIVRAVNAVVQNRAGQMQPVTAEEFARFLDTADLPDPDLIIRTGNEKRISNFLLYQAAYSELYFSSALWPDFDEELYLAALRDYATRKRRYGKI